MNIEILKAAVLAMAILLSGCGRAEPEGALSLPGPEGGSSISEALGGTGGDAWIRGFILARRGQPVLLCEALAESMPPQCSGSSLVLGDGIVWREPAENTGVIGSVNGGTLTDGAVSCGFAGDGPCTGYPGVVADGTVLWTEVEYSVLGTLTGGELGRLRCPEGADC